jgi:MerR family transcriptional regulator/heat shock protein HspR
MVIERDDSPVYVISVAAALAGMHPQTLRQYDRLGLVTPRRARGRGRRYTRRDIATLREVQRLSQDDGVNLAGIKRILELADRVEELEREVERLRRRQVADLRVFAAGPSGDVVEIQRGRRVSRPAPPESGALVLWRPGR